MTEKRSRGRPKKKILEKDAQKIKELFTEDRHLLKNDDLEENVLAKIEFTTNSVVEANQSMDFNNLNLDSTKMQETLNSQINSLDKELLTVETEYQKAVLELKEIEEIKNRLLENRLSISSIIEKEQNLILMRETELESLPANHFTADRNPLTRWVLNFFGISDEITLRSEITRSETSISQWNCRLVELNSVLSETLVGLAGYTNVLQTISLIRDSYRAIRLNLGKVRRDLNIKLKNQQNNETNQLIMQNYLENLENIKTLGASFADSASKNDEFVANLFKDFQLNPDKLLLNFNSTKIKNIENQDKN